MLENCTKIAETVVQLFVFLDWRLFCKDTLTDRGTMKSTLTCFMLQ